MPRQAKLFDSCSGSPVRGYLRLQGNIPPRWIKNARSSRKRIEPLIEKSLRKLRSLLKNHPAARVSINDSRREMRDLLKRWEVAYGKESFYRGIRILLEVQRNGSSPL
jgi:hypothetical protein